MIAVTRVTGPASGWARPRPPGTPGRSRWAGTRSLPPLLACLALAGALETQPLAAQSDTSLQVQVHGKARGWLGIDLRRETPEGASEPELYVAALVPDGPAQRAGVRVGERLDEINGVPAIRLVSEDQSLRPQFWPGDTVRLALSGHDDDAREVIVVAAADPRHARLLRIFRTADSTAWTLLPMLDSLTQFVMPDLDSLTQFMLGGMDSLTRLLSPTGVAATMLRRADATVDCDAGECRDSYSALGRMLDSVSVSIGAFSPLTPYALGQNRVAGAELAELNPHLGRYFGVEAGVLVIDVGPGTPAARSGLASGDVITAADGAAIASLPAFRRAVALAPRGGWTVTVVRNGEKLELTIPR